ncbi:transient receptor potential cation channel subfamily V member 5-like [Anneissia japonica]|uniref:transient receptor potential cation channel subfamily V member 5-like n=1 Tax=Anneissia japonica TaxID=1529436 RepID=UPI001425B409|nr:transient receptor potential cation channel subfamily V member 5-like [Anneissia japonica]
MGACGSSEIEKETDDSGNKKQIDENSTTIYSLVNSKGGGTLVDLARKAIKTGDWDELDNTIRGPVRNYLYEEETKRIPIRTLIDIRHNTCSRKGKRIKEADNNTASAIGEVKYRDQCWDLNKRGSVGETILHLCFLNNTPAHMELAKRLLNIYPALAKDIYTHDEYYGENCLHMAIANDNFEMVQYLVNHSVEINARCCGHFFSTDDQIKKRFDTYDDEYVQISKKTNYEGAKYWGEYPLSFAASLGLIHIFRYLHAKGGHINAQDSNGNTAMHMAVIHNQMVRLIYFRDPGADLGGDRKAYLEEIIDSDGILKNETVENYCYIHYTDTTEDIVRIFCESMTYAFCVFYLIYGLNEARQNGKDAVTFLMKAPSRCLFLFSCFLVLLSSVFRIPPCSPHFEDAFLIVAVLSTVPYFMFFLRAFPLIGKFVFIFYKMLFGDVLKFLAIYSVFVIGFSQAMHVIFISYKAKPGETEYYLLQSITGVFIMSLGEFDDIYNKFNQTNHHIIAKLLFAVYMVLVSLLLINMLIAMMASTFSGIDEAENEYQRQWAQIVLVMEQSLSTRARRLLQTKYSNPLCDGHIEGHIERHIERAIVMRSENESHVESKYVASKIQHSKNKQLVFDGSRLFNTIEEDLPSVASMCSTPDVPLDDEPQHFPDVLPTMGSFSNKTGIVNNGFIE